MPKPLTVETIGGKNMSDEQAKHFALSILAGVKSFIQSHRAEFEAWQQESEGKDDAF